MLSTSGSVQVNGSAVSAGQLWRMVRGHVNSLQGLAPGAHVGVWTQPALETLVALLGNALAGLVSVPLDPKLGPLELGHIATDARPVVTFAADVQEVDGRLAGVRTLPALAIEASGVAPTRVVDDAPLLVLYTSGTTGLPKGAVLSARNVASNLDALAQAWRWTSADTVVHSLPMFHVHGLVLGLFGSMRVGGRLHWLPRFDPVSMAAALGSTASTMLFAVPTMYHRLAEACATTPAVLQGLQHARVLVSGSAALPLRDQLRLEALTGRRVVERYGLTETIINCAVRVDGERVAGRVGPPLDGVELRLVDDERRPLTTRDDTTLGEVQVRGPNVFLGYLNRPEATAAVKSPDGWFSTGDLATQREDGSVRIVGRRATDLIKCGGYKVGAGEVEAALLEHPSVREAAVIGVPDDDLGERIVAFVVVGAAVEPKVLQDFVASQLSPHKRPREVTVVDALPRNAMGKVVKAKLRAR
jgi:malonyl-CoA/methylmalonyl-CoA synthetase